MFFPILHTEKKLENKEQRLPLSRFVTEKGLPRTSCGPPWTWGTETHLAMAFTASRRDSAKLTSSEERVMALNPARA